MVSNVSWRASFLHPAFRFDDLSKNYEQNMHELMAINHCLKLRLKSKIIWYVLNSRL